MAAAAEDPDVREIKDLVRQACDRWLDAHPGATLVQFAEEAGVPYTGGLMRWRGKGNGPDAANLVRLLTAAGMFDGQRGALNLAAQLVRRLDAGERLPRATLLEVADETEEVGRAARQVAGRLRRAAAAHG